MLYKKGKEGSNEENSIDSHKKELIEKSPEESPTPLEERGQGKNQNSQGGDRKRQDKERDFLEGSQKR